MIVAFFLVNWVKAFVTKSYFVLDMLRFFIIEPSYKSVTYWTFFKSNKFLNSPSFVNKLEFWLLTKSWVSLTKSFLVLISPILQFETGVFYFKSFTRIFKVIEFLLVLLKFFQLVWKVKIFNKKLFIMSLEFFDNFQKFTSTVMHFKIALSDTLMTILAHDFNKLTFLGHMLKDCLCIAKISLLTPFIRTFVSDIATWPVIDPLDIVELLWALFTFKFEITQQISSNLTHVLASRNQRSTIRADTIVFFEGHIEAKVTENGLTTWTFFWWNYDSFAAKTAQTCIEKTLNHFRFTQDSFWNGIFSLNFELILDPLCFLFSNQFLSFQNFRLDLFRCQIRP